MGRKDNLWMNLSKMKRKHPKDYDFIPNTYLLAYDYDRYIIIFLMIDSSLNETKLARKPSGS